MSFESVQRPSSLPKVLRTLLLVVSVAICVVLSTGSGGGQPSDDHGDTISTATHLPLGSSIDGRIYPADDKDVFRLDLSEASGTTDVWIYTTGDLDTAGGLFDSRGNRLMVNDDSFIVGRFTNFHLRANLRPGIYYVLVVSYRNRYIGDYTLHAEAVTDPGNSMGTATRLSLDSPTPGTIDRANNSAYFRFDFTKTTDLVVYARSMDDAPINVVVLDSGSAEISTNVWPLYRITSSGALTHGFRIRDDFGAGTYYVKISTPAGVTSHPVPFTIHAYEDVRYTDFIDECEADTHLLNNPLIGDSLYACQWHFNSQNEWNVNVEPVWEEGIMGEGVNVAVVDDGMYYAHEDLKDNVDTSRNHDYTGRDDIYTPFEHHGTHVAGLIAARDNDIGVRGVAPRATVYGYNFLTGERTVANTTDAMTRNLGVTSVSNNSWGPSDGPGLSPANSFWKLSVENGVRVGSGGKGTLYVFPGGNGHLEGDNSNLDEYANFYGVTAVCAVNDHDTRSSFSEKGANLWICAPSNDRSDIHEGILTTENSDRYYEEFGGTSASTPIVAGVAALMRSANPDLTWRDVKLILAASARKNDARNAGWQDGARKYGSTSDSDRYHFNHEYGFGVVDAKAAVDLAKEWRSLPSLTNATLESNRINLVVPDAPVIGPPETVVTSLSLNTSMRFVEFVEVNVSFRHNSFRDLRVELESPSGAVSQLSVPFDTRTDEDRSFAHVRLNGAFRFGSAKHLGEDPNGTWKLRVTDHIPGVRGTLQSWNIKVYGHESPPDAPTLDSVTAGVGNLTVAWSAPEETGSSSVTAYDLRYIQTGADETVDSLWTVEEDVWTSASAGNLEYVIAPLVGGIRYDVQVRAVNRVGVGPWSRTVIGTPLQVMTSACATGGAVADPANNPGLVSDCNALLAARDALAGSATLNWSATTSIADWQGVTAAGSPLRVTELILDDRELTGAMPTELNRLGNLKRLVLRENELTGPIPAWLGELADLEELSLWGNRFYGAIPISLGNLGNLRKLNFSQNRLSGPIPGTLGDLTNLRELSLWQNELTGPLPSQLSNLTKLQRLVLSRNELTGPLPIQLGDLPSLRVLSFWDNQLTGPIPPELGNLTNLESLLLKENKLTRSIPVSLGDLDNLERLSLGGNQLVGCVPVGLRDVTSNDFDDLDLPFCDVLLAGLFISPGLLVQTFDPYQTDYTVLTSASRVTVAAANEHSATFKLLDRNQHEIADADASLDGHQVDLNTEITVIRVKVSSHDGISTNSYTIAVIRVPSAPIISAVSSDDGNLKVSWTAPDETGGSDVIAYDLRYIQTVDGEKNESNWIVVDDVWTATLAGDLEYTITGLIGSAQYDVQVRAVNRTGAGFWSESVTKSTAPSICIIDGAVTDVDNAGLIADCEALLAARYVLAGSRSLNWSAAIPITQWKGIKIWGTPARVTSLEIRDGGLDGSIPVELGRLSGLLHLNLRTNDLRGPIPTELGDLSKLEILSLHSNRLSGPIPESLGNLSNLRQLWLQANHRKEDPTSGLSGSIPESLGKLSNLEKMLLRNYRLSGLIPVSLGRLDKLKWLTLHENLLSGSIPSELGDMEGLEILWLGGNELSGSIPPELGRLSNLTQLHLRANNFTGTVPTELRYLTNLRKLWLHQNQLSGAIPSELGDLSKLEILSLRSNQLTGSIPDELGSLANLKDLLLHDNQLNKAIPPELGNLSRLRRLWLSQNRLTGSVPASLGNLPVLTQLNLHTNQLSGPIPSELANLADTLTRLRFNGNAFSGCIPQPLSDVPDNDLVEVGLNLCP